MYDSSFEILAEFRSQLPAAAVHVLELWVRNPKHLSGFYEALLAGDYPRASKLADNENLKNFGLLVYVLNHHYPPEAHGSYEALGRWRKGLPSVD